MSRASRERAPEQGPGQPAAGDPVGGEEHLQVGICKGKLCNRDSKARWLIKVVEKG